MVLAMQLPEAVAYVLCYEILFGQAFKPCGPAERVFYKNKVRCCSICAGILLELHTLGMLPLGPCCSQLIRPRSL